MTNSIPEVTNEEIQRGFDDGTLTIPRWPEFQRYLDIARREQNGGSDRGLVLVCVSMIEEVTERLLRACLKPGRTTDDLLRSSQALGTFASRARLLNCMGVITDRQLSAIDQIRSIRNLFAHRLEASFSDQATSNKINSFVDYVHKHRDKDRYAGNEKTYFISGSTLLAAEIVKSTQKRDGALMDLIRRQEQENTASTV